MAAKPAAGAPGAETKPKSKKMLVIVLVVVLLLAVAGAAAAFFLMKPAAEEDDGGAETQATTKSSKPKTPPQYMALEAVVVNLADPGGARYAQVGITLQVDEAATAEKVKAFLPTIRNGILMQISRRSADDLLRPEGKEALASDILNLVREEAGLPAVKGTSPVQAVLFTSLIVQ